MISDLLDEDPRKLQRSFVTELDPIIVPSIGADRVRFNHFLFHSDCGFSELLVDENTGNVRWDLFYPMKYHNELKGKGLGTSAHMQILLLLSDMGVWSEIEHPEFQISDDRLRQLGKMGVLLVKDFDLYFERSADYASSKGIYY